MNEPIRILLVDDHAIVRQGTRMILGDQPDMEVVAEACEGAEAFRTAQELRPQVVLMDLNMPKGVDGITATRQIHTHLPEVRVLALTMYDDEIILERIFSAGASGVVLKNADSDEILLAIRTVAQGRTYVPSHLPRRLKQKLENRHLAVDSSLLSPREMEVLTLIAKGYANKEIAALLDISVKTVETHRTHIMERLNLSSRADLVQYAARHGLLDFPGGPGPLSPRE